MRHQTIKIYLLNLCLGIFFISNTTFAQEKDKQQYDIAAIVWPSYHPDDRAKIFWPDGIGEWQTVVSNKPKFEGHEQPRYPLWGYVNEADPYVAEMEIEAATDHGVNVFIFDWYWYDRMPFLEGHLNDGFLKAKNKDKMKFYLMWANHDVGRAWDKRGADEVFADPANQSLIWDAAVDRNEFEIVCRRIIDKYFSQPNYYRIDDKPVFMIYSMNDLIQGLGGVNETIDALNWFRKEVKKAGYKGLELQYSLRLDGQRDIVVEEETIGEEKQLVADLGFNSLTHYVYAHMTGIDRNYKEVLEDAEKIWNWVSDNYEATYYPQVSVGWDASPRAHNFVGGITKNSNPENFEIALRKAKDFVDKHPEQAPLITVNSWNEWTETSYLMPCTMHGYGYLEAIKKVFMPKTKYSDNRPEATLRMDAKDHGIVLKYGDGPNQCDILGARDVWVFEDKGIYYMHYDAAGPEGWLSSLAVSKDLTNWEKKGPILDFGKPGEDDSKGACYGVTYKEGKEWHMYYLGTPNVSSAPDLVPSFPYLTMKAKGSSPTGPWVKQPDVVPFRTKPGTYYSITASPGQIIKTDEEYLQFFSATTEKDGNPYVQRTLGIVRTNDLNSSWTLDSQPMVPIEEQIENSTLHYEKSIDTWFLFTNHIGINEKGEEFTDAIWVYWSKDLNKWDPENKAVVLDGQNCKWSKACIGLPSVVQVGNKLALFYDAPGGNSISHMRRHVGLAWLELPLRIPEEK